MIHPRCHERPLRASWIELSVQHFLPSVGKFGMKKPHAVSGHAMGRPVAASNGQWMRSLFSRLCGLLSEDLYFFDSENLGFIATKIATCNIEQTTMTILNGQYSRPMLLVAAGDDEKPWGT